MNKVTNSWIDQQKNCDKLDEDVTPTRSLRSRFMIYSLTVSIFFYLKGDQQKLTCFILEPHVYCTAGLLWRPQRDVRGQTLKIQTQKKLLPFRDCHPCSDDRVAFLHPSHSRQPRAQMFPNLVQRRCPGKAGCSSSPACLEFQPVNLENPENATAYPTFHAI